MTAVVQFRRSEMVSDTGVTLSEQQREAVEAARAWFHNPHGAQVFRLFGPAGSGKSTVASAITRNVAGKVVYCAFTGKAALRMRQTGCSGAATIHSTIYKLDEDGGDEPTFILNPKSEVAKAALVVVDEVSMVGGDLADDLLSFGVPVLVLGDPFQLPPVSGGGALTNDEPDVLLTEVHRQALDNPILRLATEVREGGEIWAPGEYGALRIVRRGTLGLGEVRSFDQVLCGTHRLRKAYTSQMRKPLGRGPFPSKGDRLICTRNNHALGFFNGGMFTVLRAETVFPSSKEFGLTVRSLDVMPGEDARVRNVTVRRECFEGDLKALPFWQRKDKVEFDFGDVITTHKAQGSEWPSVLVYDESRVFRDDAARWLYTAITRASDSLTVVTQ